MKLVFYGSSDDNFCFDVDGAPTDEIGCYNRPGVFKVLDDEGAGCYVVGHYAPGEGTPGCWSVGVMPLDEDVDLPQSWEFSFASHGYTSLLSINSKSTLYVTSWGELENEDNEGWR